MTRTRFRESSLIDLTSRFYDFKEEYKKFGGCYGKCRREPEYINGDDPIEKIVQMYSGHFMATRRMFQLHSAGHSAKATRCGPFGCVVLPGGLSHLADSYFDIISSTNLFDTGIRDEIFISKHLAMSVSDRVELFDNSRIFAVKENGGRYISRHAAGLALADLENGVDQNPGDEYLSIIFELASAIDGRRADGVSKIIRNGV